MKILFVSNLFPPNVVGGYERLASNVANALAGRGHQIQVLTSDYGNKAARSDPYKVHRELRLTADRDNIYVPSSKMPHEIRADSLHNMEVTERVVSAFQPDIIFVWNLFFLDASLIEKLESLNTPTVLFLTDNWLIAGRTPERIHKFFERFVHGRELFSEDMDLTLAGPRHSMASAAIFGAHFMRNLYASCGYDFRQSWTVHNGVQTADALTAMEVPHHGMNPKRLKLLFAGRIVDLKAPDICVRALRHIRKQIGDEVELSLTLVGDGQDVAYRKLLNDCIAADDSGASIELREPVAEAELQTLWDEHDIYLFPSTYEPFALTLILALAGGIPTVASRAGGNGEIIHHEGTGLLFDTGDAEDMADQVVRLFKNPALSASVSERGQRLARKFSFGRMIDQIETRLQSCIRT